jgi:UDP-N-acetyl-2-amino-2-deoxyglucuronate dehydrogenase
MVHRVAIVGAGRMAGFIDQEVAAYPAIALPYSHAAAYHEHPKTEIVAVCARHQESVDRFRRRWSVPTGFLDYREMIDSEKPDIVSVVTHADLHAEITMYAAEAGVRGIFCEKPVAGSLVEADAVVETCRRCGTHLLVGHLRRYHAVYSRAIEFLASGELGELVAINAAHTGELFHTGTHNFDLLNMIAQDLRGLRPSFVQATLDMRDAEDTTSRIEHDVQGVGIIRYGDALTAYVHARGQHPPLFDHELICTKGMIRVYNNGVEWDVRRIVPFERRHAPDAPQWTEAPPVSTAEKTPTPFDTGQASMTLAAVADLVQALDGGTPIRSDGAAARDALELGIGFVLSHRNGGARVMLPVAERELWVKAR